MPQKPWEIWGLPRPRTQVHRELWGCSRTKQEAQVEQLGYKRMDSLKWEMTASSTQESGRPEAGETIPKLGQDPVDSDGTGKTWRVP